MTTSTLYGKRRHMQVISESVSFFGFRNEMEKLQYFSARWFAVDNYSGAEDSSHF